MSKNVEMEADMEMVEELDMAMDIIDHHIIDHHIGVDIIRQKDLVWSLAIDQIPFLSLP